MFQNKKIIALIPLRGGSKSIPYKNIKEIAGRPLAFWVLNAAKESKYIDEVYVSTEDATIKDVVESFNLGVKVVDRALECATDEASTESVMLDFKTRVGDFNVMVLIQATSPLTTAEDMDSAIEKFFNGNYDSLFSGVLSKRFYWTLDAKPLNYDPMNRPRRQDFDGTIIENGAINITKKEILEQYQNRLGGKIGIYEMGEESALEIDEPSDWILVKELLLKHKVK